jgi:rRNA biogenesis protein RRP5
MKPSLFAEEDAERDAETDGAAGKKADVLLVDEEDEEDEDAEDDEDEDEEDEEDEDEDDDEDEDEDEDDDEGADEEAEDAEDDASDGSDDLVASDDSEEDEMDVDSEDDSEDADADADSADSDSEPMDDDGLDWDADDAKGKRDRGGDDEADAIANDLMDSKPLTKREKARKKAAKEMELHKKEQALKTRADAAPETASEFEKALMGNPRSSFLWIRYAAFHVSVGAHDEARAVAERALKAIPASDQDEKMNVWVMYLNLEHAHGKPNPRDAVAKLFARACAVANPKKLHLALAGTHERGGDFEAQTALLAAATRKFSQSAKVWIAHARAAILAKERQKNAPKKNNESVDPDAVKKALDRASQSLPKRKVVKVLVQVALVEIREGSRERGRSVFESVLRNYPRRTDIWSTYVDQEIKMFAESGDPERCRGLLERATHLELNPKAMKFLFKRYLDFERKVGDAKRVEHVKERAMQYVASKFG